MNLSPTKDRVVIKPAPREETTASGIIVKKGALYGHHREGDVIAVGPKVESVRRGDRVVFEDDVERDREHERLPHPFRGLIAVREDEVICVVEG